MVVLSVATKTSPCNEHPLISHFYIVKLGFTGVNWYTFFLIFALKHRLWVLIRTASVKHRLWVLIRTASVRRF